MIVYPALDLLGGQVVRLRHGAREAATVYSHDPAQMAARWESEGAEWLHVVDLDRAFGDGHHNLQAVRAIAGAVKIPFQVGGGLRSTEDVEEAFGFGAARVILGTRALKDRAWLEEMVQVHGEKIAVAIDARKGHVEIRGWLEATNTRALDFAVELAKLGVPRVIVTDIDRDGTLEGANLRLAESVARSTHLKVIASGGAASIDELMKLKLLKDAGLEGIVVGRALYDLRFTLAQAHELLGHA